MWQGDDDWCIAAIYQNHVTTTSQTYRQTAIYMYSGNSNDDDVAFDNVTRAYNISAVVSDDSDGVSNTKNKDDDYG